MNILNNNHSNFYKELQTFLDVRFENIDEKINLEVKNIIDAVKFKGDEALIDFFEKI